MKRRSTAMLSVFLLLTGALGCSLAPRKAYLGPDRPTQELSLIVQTENLEYRPVFIHIPTPDEVRDLPLDDLGILVLPGTYAFRAKLYHSRLQERKQLATVPIVPGESDFPAERTELRWTRADAPYKETEEARLTLEAGLRYEIWCSDDEQIRMKVLGPYR